MSDIKPSKVITGNFTHSQDGYDWLAALNKELESKLDILEEEVHHWKTSANESIERLKKINKRKGASSYVESFYESLMKKLLQGLIDENVVLKKESMNMCKNDDRKIIEQNDKIRRLKEQFEIKCEENEILLNEIENIQCSEATSVLKTEFTELDCRYSKILNENLNLKRQLNYKADLIPYINVTVNKLEDEFFKIFLDYYHKHGNGFIEQFEVDNHLPPFLEKPLMRDVTTSMENAGIKPLIPKLDDPDFFKDSGIDTLPDDFRELMSVSRELEEANITIRKLEEFSSEKEDQTPSEYLLKLSKEKEEYLESLENQCNELEEDFQRKSKTLIENENEVKSWKSAIAQYSEDAKNINKEKMNLERKYKLLEEQHKELLKSVYSPEIYRSKDSKDFTAEAGESNLKGDDSFSRYSFGASLFHSASIEQDGCESSKKIESNEVSTPADMSITCEICNEYIEANEYYHHLIYCRK